MVLRRDTGLGASLRTEEWTLDPSLQPGRAFSASVRDTETETKEKKNLKQVEPMQVLKRGI